jgi:hypothetical protein
MEDLKNNVPEIDPTANVLKLVEEATKRLDDLRVAEAVRVNGILELTRIYEVRLADKEVELREAESKRLDAIRAVDNVNVTRNAENARAEALALAKNVTDTATMMAKQLESNTVQQSLRISALEAIMSEMKGKSTMEDDLPKRLNVLERASSAGEGKSKGLKDIWGYIVGAIGLTATLILLGEKIFGG